ncbi:MAG: DNA-directed RNA polymerase subunit alpha [Chloroflexia bacterium]
MSNATPSVMPNVTAVATATNYGRFVIGPMETGIGIPLGNALRRILLSSLPGSAVTSVRIQNVYHEFSCIPSVREDVTEIVLNVKNIRLRAYSDRSIRLQLSKRGMGEVRAGDIDVPANVELVNPDLVIATLDSDDAQFEMELTVEPGRGYVSFDAREGLPIGSIPVDATFSPIPKVNYLIETADFDLLTSAYDPEDGTPELALDDVEGKEQVLIEIWSDGTIDPGEALSLAAQLLAQHSSLIANFNKIVVPPQGRELPGIDIPAHLFEMSIEDLSLSMRTYNCLKRSGVTKVGQILRMDRKELLGLRNFGEKSFDELYEVLSTRELIPPGVPLDFSVGSPVDSGGDEGEGGEGDNEGVDSADMEIGYAEMTDDASEPAVYMAEPSGSADGQSLQVVDELGVSEGSAAMAAGIFIDDEPASEIDMVDIPDMVEAGNVEAEAKPKKSSKK